MKHKNKVNEFIKNPKKALFVLSSPIIISMLVQTMYNIVDTAFVGRLGSNAIAALTFSFPIFFLLIAINSGISIGMNSRVSRFLGEKRKKDAENTVMHAAMLSIILSIIVFVSGILYLKPVFYIFGATGEVLKLSYDYMSIILYGIFFMFFSYLASSIFSAQGNTKTPMKINIISLVLNIILAPIFIYVLGYGVKGSALATVISLFFAFVMFVYHLIKHSYLEFHIKNFSFSKKILKEIIFIGVPASMMMVIMSVYVIFINRVMVYFSIDHVASFGIVSRLESLAVLPVVALSISLVTLVGMFAGAKRYDLIKKINLYGTKMAVIFTLIVGFLFFVFPALLLKIFTSDKNLLAIAVPYLRFDVFTFPFIAISMMVSRTMQGLGYGMPGFIVNFIRVFVVAVPLAYFFVHFLDWNYLSVAIAMILGGIAASIVGLFWLRAELKKQISKHHIYK